MKEVKYVIDENTNYHIYLNAINPSGPFPGKIYAHALCKNDPPIIYIPCKIAKAIIVMEDDYNVVGHCTCSICNESINMFDKYCVHCGAKIKGQIFLGENNEENSSVHISY